nr:MAG TPA: hypothetical protein [Caudoviricetes sp.]
MTRKKLLELSEKAVYLFTDNFKDEKIINITSAAIFALAYMCSLQTGEHINTEAIAVKALVNLRSLEGDSHGNLKNS